MEQSALLPRSTGKLRVRKDSQGLVIREGFMEEAAVLDLKDSWALDGQRGREGVSRVGSAGVRCGGCDRRVAGCVGREESAASSSSSHLLTAPGRWGWGQNIQRQGPALKKVPF